jgi:hypothetical protein
MAKILRQAPTGDGYDVRFLANDGQAYVLHWQKEPVAKTLAAALKAFETELAKPPDKAAELATKVSAMLQACNDVTQLLAEKPDLKPTVTDATAVKVVDVLTKPTVGEVPK